MSFLDKLAPSKFQLIFLMIFIGLGVIGVLMFAGIIPKPQGDPDQEDIPSLRITIWGTYEHNRIRGSLNTFSEIYDGQYSLDYIEKKAEDLEIDLLRAANNNTAPDLLLIPHTEIIKLEKLLLLIPETTFTERQFKNIFVEAGEVLLTAGGAYGLPFLIDPTVMYWNRDTFNDFGITETPKTWSSLLNFSRKVTNRNNRNEILKSAVALGESNNIDRLTEILSTMIIQTGDPIVERIREERNRGGVRVALGGGGGTSSSGEAHSALRYYVGYADPVKSHYTWNSSFLNSLDKFSAGETAIAFGRASDYHAILERNPHLNFDIAQTPQLEVRDKDVVYGIVYALAIPKAADRGKIQGIFRVLYLMTYLNDDVQLAFQNETNLATSRRDILARETTDPIATIVSKSAIISKSWLNPNAVKTEEIFMRMVEKVQSGEMKPESAVSQASGELLLEIP